MNTTTNSLVGANDSEMLPLQRELLDRLRTNPAIFNFLEEGGTDGVWYWDLEDPSQEWLSPGFKKFFGFEDHEMAHTPEWWQANIHPDDLTTALANYEAHLADPNHPYDQVVRYRHRDGDTVWVRCRGLIIRDENDRPLRMLGVHTDVTNVMREKQIAQQTANFSRAVLDSVQAGIMKFEAVRDESRSIVDLKMVEANKSALGIVGRDYEAVVGRNLSETFPGNFEDGLFDRYKTVIDTQESTEFELYYAHEGLDHYFLVTAVASDDNSLVISFTDVSNLRRATAEIERQRAEMQRFFNKTPAICHSLDDQGRIQSTSDSWLEAFQYERNEVIGRSLFDFMTPESRHLATEIVFPEFLKTHIPIRRQAYTWVRKDGSVFEGEVSAHAYSDDDGVSFQTFGVIEDVTQRNQALRAAEDVSQSLRQVNRQLERFAHVASHDLQSPLRKITAMTDLIGLSLDDGDLVEARALLKRLGSLAADSRSLVADLLALAELQHLKPAIEQIDLREVVLEISEALSVEQEENRVKIIPPEDKSMIAADRRLLGLLMTNLIGNGIKYARKDVEAFVAVEIVAMGDGQQTIAVRDNGIGFDDSKKSQIFEAFRRLNNVGSVPGTGIGLSICSEICQRLRWTIDCASKPNQGSVFFMRLSR